MIKKILHTGFFVVGMVLSVGSASAVSVDVENGYVNVDVGGGGTNVKVNGTTGAAANVTVGGNNVNVNSDLLIKTDADLDTYNQVVLKERPSVKAVAVTTNGVSATYRQPARFLGIFRSSLGATVSVDNNGKVSVKLPWYSFLYSKNTVAVRAKTEADLKQSVSKNEVDLKLIGKAKSAGATSDATTAVTVQNNAHVINVLTNSVQVSISGE